MCGFKFTSACDSLYEQMRDHDCSEAGPLISAHLKTVKITDLLLVMVEFQCVRLKLYTGYNCIGFILLEGLLIKFF